MSLPVLLLILFAFVAQGFLIAYFSYFKKVGEYQAMKEEIDGITTTTEKIKKDIGIVAQRQISFENETRKSITELNDVVTESTTFLMNGIWSDTSADLYLSYMKDVLPKILAAQSKVLLYTKNDNIHNLVSTIIREQLDILGEATGFINEVNSIEKGNGAAVVELTKEYHKKLVFYLGQFKLIAVS